MVERFVILFARAIGKRPPPASSDHITTLIGLVRPITAHRGQTRSLRHGGLVDDAAIIERQA
jgi:hypothetical protein